MKRILALDGGGIRGVFSLEVLLRMETLLREASGNDKLVLADHFDMFAGTSTGAIIATLLCWGKSVTEILNLYKDHSKTMFTPVSWAHPIQKLFYSKYRADKLSEYLNGLFLEKNEATGAMEPALLGTKELKKLLLVVVRNLSTSSSWPLTNNPLAMFNDRGLPYCNLNVPLWQVVRASTAAPVYFDPEELTLGEDRHLFVDGAITPYNNPALIAAMMVTLPPYRINWPVGEDQIRVVSVGTMRFVGGVPKGTEKVWLGANASKIPAALMQGSALQQDFMSRCLGRCLYGEEIDSEVGDLIATELPGSRWYSYVRYNQTYRAKALEEILKRDPRLSALDAVKAIPALEEVGREYADAHVRLEHLI